MKLCKGTYVENPIDNHVSEGPQSAGFVLKFGALVQSDSASHQEM